MDDEEEATTDFKPPKYATGHRQEAIVGGHKVVIWVADYPNGFPCELKFEMHRAGAAHRGILEALGQAVSLGLRHGTPLEEFVEEFVFTRFEPEGMVIGHERIKNATSILDYIFRHLAIRYLKRDDLAHTATPVASSTNANPVTHLSVVRESGPPQE